MKSIEIIRTREKNEEPELYLTYDIRFDGQTVGAASVTIGVTEDGKEIHENAYCERIDVEEAYRNLGIGTAALKALSSEFGSIFLAPDNEDAQRLYDRIGYEVTDKGDWYAVDQGFGVYEI